MIAFNNLSQTNFQLAFSGLKMVVCPVEVVIADIGHVLLNSVEMFSELLFEILLIKFAFGLERLTQNCWELEFKG
jgi:hypothetical protein